MSTFVPGLVALSLASGLVGGVFLSFSDFVMRSLGASQPVAGIEAMQQINRKVYRSVFMVLLLGTGPVAIAASVLAAFAVGGAMALAVGAGAAVYVLGVMAVTIAGNVPMNERLDRMAFGAAETRAYWPVYLRRWTGWNHVRVLASTLSAALFATGAVLAG